MKKILLSISLVSSQVIFSQIYTPSGAVNTTENPATGNVGIGTTNPQAKLEVNGSVYVNSENSFIGADAWNESRLGIVKKSGFGPILATGFSYPFIIGNWSLPNINNNISSGTFTELMRILPNGNVGIGTLTPTSKLTVAGDIAYGENFTNTLFRDDAGAFGTGVKSGFYQALNPVNFPTGATSWWHLLDIRHSNPVNNYAMQFSGSFFDQDLWFRKTNHNAQQPWRRVIMEQSNGNVGIGIDNPQNKLDVNGDLKIIGNSKILYNNKIVGWDDPNNYYLGHYPVTGSSGLDIHWYGGIKFGVSGNSNAMQILENGNVGIGTSNPQYKLEVAGSTAVKGVLYVHGADLSLGKGDGRAQGNLLDQRALVHGDADILWLNYGGDFEGGTQIGNGSFFKNDGNASLQGKLEAKEVKVTTTPTADFVFEKDYQLPTLEEVEKHIKEKKHLPEIASAKQMEKEGVNVGEFQIKLLQKIEEMTLYQIEMNRQIKELKEKIQKLENK